jgi:penicillin amidase
MSKVIAWLYAPDGRFGADPIAGRDALLARSLEEGVAELNKRFGSDMENWKLGAYHHATIMHPISSALKESDRVRFDVGNLPRGGDAFTIDATGLGDNQTAGGSLKAIMDTEDWDHSIAQNNPGQSGDVNDPHYRDLYELWARGKYFPIVFSRARVESVTEKKVQLSPADAEHLKR